MAVANTEGLLEWAKANGTSLSPNVEIYNDDVTGLSFRAADDIPSSTSLVNCSYTTTLSYLNAAEVSPFQRHSAPFPTNFLDGLRREDPNVVGHFFLVQQYLLGKDSFWREYVRVLPQPDSKEASGLPVLWSEDDRRWLDGTNAEPPLQKRRNLWEEEWKMGMELLREGSWEGYEDYSFELYQWAASIFGSRSFRASLTIPEEIIQSTKMLPEHYALNLEHIQKDRFSVLLPVMDIGNHNGVNQVDWSKGADQFSLKSRIVLTRNSQIYNFYGDKSNSELLVGYGFTLPNGEKDTVNLKLTPGAESIRLRRSQTSHIIDVNQPEQEFMFHVKLPAKTVPPDQLLQLQVFSSGLIDTMSCMVANKRERRFLQANLQCSLEKKSFSGSLSRNIVLVLRILRDKLQYELSRIQTFGRGLSHVELLSLECAFAWLQLNYPDLAAQAFKIISEDQDEPLPLDWAVLVEDWDHSYWTVWIYILWTLRLQNKKEFETRHPKLGVWMSGMDLSYDEELASDVSAEKLYADQSEQETIDGMINNLTSQSTGQSACTARLRNFASYISLEETVPMSYQMPSGTKANEFVAQKLLCVTKIERSVHDDRPTSGPWTRFLNSIGS
ncbi:uncharacterized protein L3040_008011 [Drepanopeziza brunnea f. sp. 'multigermtubi']|uniref:uncharacterized protein n=1 Tax=Drepanopeziza brunnea f. sp. 'multigermtubi' TaxID=698441 RepID=UPI00239943C8|nr:hypothetical protein L3040_008011 [Drepanopeziza brunnea f. sp. 'multigermtubi']